MRRQANVGATSPAVLFGKPGSFLREQRSGGGGASSILGGGGSGAGNGNGAGKFGWLVLALALGALLGGMAAVAGSCRQEHGDTEHALQTHVNMLMAQVKELETVLEACRGKGDISGSGAVPGNSRGAKNTDCTPAASSAVAQIVVRDTSDYVDAERKDYDAELKAALSQLNLGASGRKEVLVAVSNKALINQDGTYGMLATWIEQVRASGVTNAMVVCLDDEIEQAMKAIGFPHWRYKSKIENKDQSQDNHGISGRKYTILREFLVLGFRNPFDHLVRDSDVEGMTDGFDDAAYMRLEGVTDSAMGWSQYAQSWKVFAMNSGLFYLRANERTIALMEHVADQLVKDKIWDQTAYNIAVLKPSSPKHKNPGVSVRIMDYELFMNSKYLFKHLRHGRGDRGSSLETAKPSMVHVNYHPDKWERMKAIIKWRRQGDTNALKAFPDGSCWHPPECKPN